MILLVLWLINLQRVYNIKDLCVKVHAYTSPFYVKFNLKNNFYMCYWLMWTESVEVVVVHGLSTTEKVMTGDDVAVEEELKN